MELTEHGGAKLNRLGDDGLKNNLITASNGSLVSTGWVSTIHFIDHNRLCLFQLNLLYKSLCKEQTSRLESKTI